jgi:hypothetical protein
MSCYLRHLREVFSQAGIEITPENRKRADRIIHDMMGVEYKDCPHAWKLVKARLEQDHEGFIGELARRWKQNAP